MRQNQTFRLFWIVTFLASGLILQAQAGHPEIVSVKKIWDHGAYNSFADLTRFKKKWYCTFRESDSHEGGQNGKVRVIASSDSDHWESVALLAQSGRDLRDPKISVTADGRLMVVTGACLYEGHKQITRDSRVSFSDDGVTWTPLELMLVDAPGEHESDGHQIWRVTWNEGQAYGVSKLVRPHRVILVTSKDGVHWKQLAKLNVPDEAGGQPAKPTEATVRFLDNGDMMILFRQAWIGISPPPFTEWTWHKVDLPPKAHARKWAPRVPTIAGPNFLQIPDGSIWGTGRQYYLPLPPTNREKRTVLARMDRTSYTPVLILPSGGDNSYAGMVWHEGHLWVSYYSCTPGISAYYGRERDGAIVTGSTPEGWYNTSENELSWPNIYLAKIEFHDSPRQRTRLTK